MDNIKRSTIRNRFFIKKKFFSSCLWCWLWIFLLFLLILCRYFCKYTVCTIKMMMIIMVIIMVMIIIRVKTINTNIVVWIFHLNDPENDFFSSLYFSFQNTVPFYMRSELFFPMPAHTYPAAHWMMMKTFFFFLFLSPLISSVCETLISIWIDIYPVIMFGQMSFWVASYELRCCCCCLIPFSNKKWCSKILVKRLSHSKTIDIYINKLLPFFLDFNSLFSLVSGHNNKFFFHSNQKYRISRYRESR